MHIGTLYNSTLNTLASAASVFIAALLVVTTVAALT
jgi:hypothetical protein